MVPDSASALQKALSFLERGEVVIGPTDTVYGLLAPMGSRDAVDKIRRLKGLGRDRPLVVLVPSCGWAQLLSGQPLQQSRLPVLWPGPLTMVVRASQKVPDYVRGKETTVALRWPGDSFVRRVMDALLKPLVAPSANLTGQPTARTAEEVMDVFGKHVGLIIKGDDPVEGDPSTIVSIAGGSARMLRQGRLPRSSIAAICDLA